MSRHVILERQFYQSIKIMKEKGYTFNQMCGIYSHHRTEAEIRAVLNQLADNEKQHFEMNIYNLEGLQAVAEGIILSAQHSYWNYDSEGNYLHISEDERDRRMFEWIENIKDQPLCVRKCEALKKLSFYDVLDMPLKEIKETFLKDYLRTLRGIFRKGTGNFEHVPSEDIPDEYLDDLLALKYKEYLKLWTMQWDMVKKMEAHN